MPARAKPSVPFLLTFNVKGVWVSAGAPTTVEACFTLASLPAVPAEAGAVQPVNAFAAAWTPV